MKHVYLLDSVILIDVLRGIPGAVSWAKKLHPGEAAISVITRAEVLSGGPDEEQDAAQTLCDQFDCLPLDADAADQAARLRLARRWKLPDAIQAALAQRNGLRLATRNTKDFDPSRDAFVFIPYRVALTQAEE
ncbi:MAG TPA: PIN domain-containing protein [Kiritimatiellia bacterium]|nr:PIN domain-containing protein [Kiritimatiellia bacterium]HMO98293.1 PIN domain-containing protein [Kiritimatiellia bacterium]